MRSMLWTGIVMMLAAGPAFTQPIAQPAPGEMLVVIPEVEVRSGPALKFNATSKLRQGDRVIVVPDSKAQGNWLAIKPPPDSFSWIDAKSVLRQQNTQIAAVIGDSPVPVRPGSKLTTRAPDVESVQVKPGHLVVIAGPELTTDGGTWLPIQPPPQDVRYIPAEAVRPAPVVASAPGPLPANVTAGTLIAQADQAVRAGQVEQAKQLYKQALDRTGPNEYQERIHCQNALTSLNGSQTGNPVAASANPSASAASGQMTALYRTSPNPNPGAMFSYPAQWSKWGQLRDPGFQKNGLPVYVLETRQGQPLLYVTTQPGFSLRDYIGKTVSLYGPVTYRSDEYMRMHYMTASHVATVP